MTALILLAFGVPILVVGAIYVVVRPRINHGGASDQEHVSTCPGDELVARPSFVWTTRSPSRRRPELVVAGRDRCWPTAARPLPEQCDLVMNGSSKQSREAN
jgi:hypothetical protein